MHILSSSLQREGCVLTSIMSLSQKKKSELTQDVKKSFSEQS